MSVTVFLANKGFTLPVTDLDERRREAYFKNPTDTKNKLLPEEDKILMALGINKENASCLMPHLANFFKQLPKCQSDSSLVLAKDCEIVQYVLWETLFAARTRSQEMYDENWKTKKPLADISAAINKQIINDLKPKPDSLNPIEKLFKLILKASIPGKEVNPVDTLFTLIVPSKMGENPQPVAPSPPGSIAVPSAPEVLETPTAPPATPPAPGSTIPQNNAGSAITAPSVSSESSLSTQKTEGTRSTQPNRPSWFTRKFGKKPLTSTPGQQINLGRTPNNEGEAANHPGESPFTKPPVEPLSGEEADEFQQENPMVPSANRVGESPFTQQSTVVGLGPEREPPLGIVPADDTIENQCEGQPRPTERETHEEEFKRSLYFFYSIKHQEDIDLATANLNPDAEKKFTADWQKAIKGSRDKIAASLKFLGVPANKLVEMNAIYRNFINGGNGPHPILAHECNKIGETAAGLLERFYETVERTPSQRTYLFQHGDWPSGNGSDISLQTPTSVNTVDVSVRDTSRNDYFLENELYHLTILTTQDINYTENNDFDYNIQGKHITDYLLIRDLFAKNKNYVLDISPQLIYLFYRERNIPRPTPDGHSITINEAFFKNAFGGNHIPPQLSSNLQVQGQVDMAYYAICNSIMVGDKKPYQFYSKPTSRKLNDIIQWLENATDSQYSPIKNLMKWAVPMETPLEKSVLLDLFKSVAKKPESYFTSMFTRKNKKNKNVAATRRNRNQEALLPRNALTEARAAAAAAPPQSLLEIPALPKKGTQTQMDDATLRNILARANANAKAKAALEPSFVGTAGPESRAVGPNAEQQALIRQRANALNAARRAVAATRGRNALRRGLKTRRLENIRRRAAEEQALLPPDGVWTGRLNSPAPRNETEGERVARESVAAREAAQRGRNALRRGLRTRRLGNIRRRAQEIQAEEEADRTRILERAQQNLNALRAASRNKETAPNDERLVLQEPPPSRRNSQPTQPLGNTEFYNGDAIAPVPAPAPVQAPVQAAATLPRRGWRNWARGRTLNQAAEAKAERARLREEAAIEARLKQQLNTIKAEAGSTNERLVAVRIAIHRLKEYIADRERDIQEKEEQIREKKVEGAAAAAAYTAAKGKRDESSKRDAAAAIVKSLRLKESMLQKLQRYVQEARSKIERHQAEQVKLEADEVERRRQVLAASEEAVRNAERQHATIARMFNRPPNPAEAAALQAELNAL